MSKVSKKEGYAKLGAVLTAESSKFEELLNVLKLAGLEEDPKSYIANLNSSDLGLEPEELIAAFSAGNSYYESGHFFFDAEEKSGPLLQEIIESLAATDTTLIEEIKTRLISIIEAFKPQERVTRINSALLSDERVFKGASVSVQLRPVFKDETESSIDTLVSVFNLRAEYYAGGKQKEFHISLLLNDVNDLIASLENAREQLDLIKEALPNKHWDVVSSII